MLLLGCQHARNPSSSALCARRAFVYPPDASTQFCFALELGQWRSPLGCLLIACALCDIHVAFSLACPSSRSDAPKTCSSTLALKNDSRFACYTSFHLKSRNQATLRADETSQTVSVKGAQSWCSSRVCSCSITAEPVISRKRPATFTFDVL